MLSQTRGETLFPGTPPTECQCGCRRSLSQGFVDGRLKRPLTAWGYFAPSRYASIGAGFGMGRGQQWHRTASDQFALVKLSPEIV